MAKKFYVEYSVTLYHLDVFEADSVEEAEEMMEYMTWEWDKHLDDVFIGREVTSNDMQACDYVDSGELTWAWDGPVISKDEFKSEYTSL